jgi:hypothetical protein
MSLDRLIQSNAELQYPSVKPELDLNFTRKTLKGIDAAYSFTRNSAATYVGPDGLIKTAAANQPRFDYDILTGDYKGLFIEESRTNIATWSEGFNISAWTSASDYDVLANDTTSPDGTTTADYIYKTNPTNPFTGLIRNFGGLTSNTTYTFSYYHKAKERDAGSLVVVESGTFAFIQTLPRTITNVGNGWKRTYGSFNIGSRTSVGFKIELASGSTWTGTQGYYLWGAQLEAGSFPTSYIPTSGSTVTRQPDQLVLNKTLNTQGTFFIESNPSRGVSSNPTRGIPLVADNGSSSLSIVQPTNQYTRSVLYYNTNRTLRMSSDNSVPIEFNTLNPQDLNRVSLGFNRFNNSSYINGYLKKFSYYSSPLSEDNLRALTNNKTSTVRLSENIVTDGLLLYLDAGNPSSYPGSGTTWTDLSGNGNNGTLTNGPTFSSSNGGSIVFDGANDHVNCGLSSFQPTAITLCAWVKHTVSTDGAIIVKGDVNEATEWGIAFGYSSPHYLIGRATTFNNQLLYSWTGSLLTGFHYVCYTMINNTSARLYVDGVLVASTNTIGSIGLNAKNVLIGKWNNYGALDGNIAQVSIYNRALTAAEVSQNFNAQRNRFGI